MRRTECRVLQWNTGRYTALFLFCQAGVLECANFADRGEAQQVFHTRLLLGQGNFSYLLDPGLAAGAWTWDSMRAQSVVYSQQLTLP